jgi:hypothetical protein
MTVYSGIQVAHATNDDDKDAAATIMLIFISWLFSAFLFHASVYSLIYLFENKIRHNDQKDRFVNNEI